MDFDGSSDWAPNELGQAEQPEPKKILSDETLFDGPLATARPAEQSLPAAAPMYPPILDDREPSTMIIQVAIVALASAAVGVLVFMGIRSAFDAEDSAALDSDGDVSTNVFIDDAGENEQDQTGTNERFGTAQINGEALIGPDESRPVSTTIPSTVPQGPRVSSPTSLISSQVPVGNAISVPSLLPPTLPSSTIPGALPPTTALGPTTAITTPTTPVATTVQPVTSSVTTIRTSTTPTTRRPTTAPTTRPTTASTTRPTTTRPTTTRPTTASTARPTTTPSTPEPTTTPTTESTTSSSTSTTLAPVEVEILSPGVSDIVSWSGPVLFEASELDDADTYCWSFDAVGSTSIPRVYCTSDASSEITFEGLGLNPGRFSVELVAKDEAQDELGSDSVSISVRATDVIVSPAAGATVVLDERIEVKAKKFSNAEEYCWTLRQAGTDGEADVVSDKYCTSLPERAFASTHGMRQGITAGPATLELEIRDGLRILGASEVDLVFTEPESSTVADQPGTPEE